MNNNFLPSGQWSRSGKFLERIYGLWLAWQYIDEPWKARASESKASPQALAVGLISLGAERVGPACHRPSYLSVSDRRQIAQNFSVFLTGSFYKVGDNPIKSIRPIPLYPVGALVEQMKFCARYAAKQLEAALNRNTMVVAAP